MATQFLGKEAIQTLRATEPAYRLREIDQTAPAGMWQMDAEGGDLVFAFATAADWSAFTPVVTMTDAPGVTIHGTLTFSGTVVFEANIRLDDDIVAIFGTGNDFYMGYSATDDRLEIGTGATIAANVVMSVDSSGVTYIGSDGGGLDYKLFGSTAGRYALWDASADGLIVQGTAPAITAASEGAGALESPLRIYNPDSGGARGGLEFANDSGGAETVHSRISGAAPIYFDVSSSMTRALSLESDASAAFENGALAIKTTASAIPTNSQLHVEGSGSAAQISQGDIANDAGVFRQVIHKENVATGSAQNCFYIRTVNETGSTDGGAYACRVFAVVKTPGDSDGSSDADIGTMGHSAMFAVSTAAAGGTTTTAVVEDVETAYAGPSTQTIDGIAFSLVGQTRQVLCKYNVTYSGSAADNTCDLDIVIELTYTTFLSPPIIDIL